LVIGEAGIGVSLDDLSLFPSCNFGQVGGRTVRAGGSRKPEVQKFAEVIVVPELSSVSGFDADVRRRNV
jgi:hypothetical protein